MQHYTRLRDLREDADLTQEQLVQKLGMHKTTYTNYEQGKREPPFDFIIKIAKFYNVSIDYIAGFTNEPRKIK
ncbi:MAG: helix-turn-helix transcriptional regulator [Oscillospiraceae bacterium]|nr:helix-turn-helix transcriptional regulator [Oscillospiraceae bacterium]MBR3962458.1 helix-turn-helix transcriptional regulator [Oscillospiraceae bacterium]